MKDKLKAIATRLRHEFNNLDLLEQALTHRSAGSMNNERLEFLGDAILGYAISSELYRRHPNAKEGELSRMRSSLVNGEVLAQLAVDLNIGEYLNLGSGERKSGGAMRESILADAMEAIIGAIYLDAGIEKASQFIVHWYGESVDDLSQLQPVKDAKSQLQEWLQGRGLPLPQYASTITGKAHSLKFEIVCSVEGLPHRSIGVSSSRRKAEQMAAEKYLEFLDEE